MPESGIFPGVVTPDEFRERLREVFGLTVANLNAGAKQRLAVAVIDELVAATREQRPALRIVPATPGHRPVDEALHPGSGCSEEVGLVSTDPDAAPTGDEVWLLYRLVHLDRLPDGVAPEDLEVRMSLAFVPPVTEGQAVVPVPRMSDVPVPPRVVSRRAHPNALLEESSFAAAADTRFVAVVSPSAQLRPGGASGWTWDEVDEGLRRRTPDGADPYTFAHQFHQRVRVVLTLRARGQVLSE